MKTKIWAIILVVLISLVATNVLIADPGDYNVEGRIILLDGDGDTDIGSITDDNFILTVGGTAELTVTQTSSTFGGNILNTGTNDITSGDDIFVGDDLVLTSSGSVINFNSGEVTLTHGAGGITVAGGLAVEWADLGIVTTINIDGGTLDNVTLGASNPVTLQGLDLDNLVEGDTLYASAADTLARLAKGSDTEVLTLASGIPSWVAPASAYSDSQAILAVEGELTLNLSGDVTIADDKFLIIGHTEQSANTFLVPAKFQILGDSSDNSAFGMARFEVSSGGPNLLLTAGRGVSIGDLDIVLDNDSLGTIRWAGMDGITASSRGAAIDVSVDGTPGNSDMPSRMDLRTSNDGSSSPSTRLRIDSAGDFTFNSGDLHDLGDAGTDILSTGITFGVPTKINDMLSTAASGSTLGSGVTTFSVAAKGNVVQVDCDGGGNTIATITGGIVASVVTFLFVDSSCTITDDNGHGDNTIDLNAAFTSADDTVLQLLFHGGTGSWYEISRSVN